MHKKTPPEMLCRPGKHYITKYSFPFSKFADLLSSQKVCKFSQFGYCMNAVFGLLI